MASLVVAWTKELEEDADGNDEGPAAAIPDEGFFLRVNDTLFSQALSIYGPTAKHCLLL